MYSDYLSEAADEFETQRFDSHYHNQFQIPLAELEETRLAMSAEIAEHIKKRNQKIARLFSVPLRAITFVYFAILIFIGISLFVTNSNAALCVEFILFSLGLSAFLLLLPAFWLYVIAVCIINATKKPEQLRYECRVATLELKRKYRSLYYSKAVAISVSYFQGLTHQDPASEFKLSALEHDATDMIGTRQLRHHIFGTHRGIRIDIVHVTGPHFFARFEFPRSLEGSMLVGPEKGSIMNFLERIDRKLERVGLEDTIFEKNFEVYASDQVGSRMILTPRFMQAINACFDGIVPNAENLKLAQCCLSKNAFFLNLKAQETEFSESDIKQSAYRIEPLEKITRTLAKILRMSDFLANEAKI